MDKKELKVVALRNGTVIDHIPSDKLFKVVSILQLDKVPNQITIGNNLESKQLGTKGIVKISDLYLDQKSIDKIALLAPAANLNIIHDYMGKEKFPVRLPEEVTDIVRCSNPKCITNNQPVPTKFRILKKEPIQAQCCYCERVLKEEEIRFK